MIKWRLLVEKFSNLLMIIATLLIKKQQKTELMDLRTFYYPLTDIVWICMISSCLMVVIAKLILVRTETNLIEVFWSSFAPYFGGYFDDEENGRMSHKVAIFVALFSGNIIWMGYQASLTVDLSSPTNKMPFNDLKTFLDSGWSLHTYKKGYLSISNVKTI